MKDQRSQLNNYVAKHAHKYNRAATFVDKKRAVKRGYTKHKHHE